MAKLLYALGPPSAEELWRTETNMVALEKGLILDAACGPGTVGRRIASHTRTVYGVDISMGMLRRGVRYVESGHIPADSSFFGRKMAVVKEFWGCGRISRLSGKLPVRACFPKQSTRSSGWRRVYQITLSRGRAATTQRSREENVQSPVVLVGSLVLRALYETGWVWALVWPLSPIVEGWLGLPDVAGLTLIFAVLRKELALQLLIALAIV